MPSTGTRCLYSLCLCCSLAFQFIYTTKLRNSSKRITVNIAELLLEKYNGNVYREPCWYYLMLCVVRDGALAISVYGHIVNVYKHVYKPI